MISKILWVLQIWTGAGALVTTISFVVRQDNKVFQKYPKKGVRHAYAVWVGWGLSGVIALLHITYSILV